MFNLYGIDRLTEWRNFRDQLETSTTPFNDVAELWANAPFVSPYLDPKSPKTWPDPWHLVIDNRLDDLAITLGMLYTLSLTERFKDTPFEVRELKEESDSHYILVVDNRNILNLEYRRVATIDSVNLRRTNILWASEVGR